MKRYVFAAIWLGSASIAVFAQGSQSKPETGPLVDSKRLFMQIEQVPLTGTTNVFGDPAKAGTYITRVQLAANAKVRPHFYDQDRWVTVLKGTWWVGEGDVFKFDRLIPVREGGLMYQPANLHHFEMAGSGEVILQIVGNGPVKSTHSEVDANGQPVAVGGPYPEDSEGEGRGRRRGRGRGAIPPNVQPDPDDPDQQQPRRPQ